MNFKNWMEAAEIVKERCQPFLKQTQRPMYRGTSFPASDFFSVMSIQQVRKDRRPRDTDATVHKLVDDWFFEKYGLRPRSQAAFCTQHKDLAADYGSKTCYVFPVGSFDYVWGKWIIDRIPRPDKEKGYIKVEKDDTISDSVTLTNSIHAKFRVTREADIPKVVDEYMNYVDWQINTGLDTALSKLLTEIAIICDEIILVDADKVKDYEAFLKSMK